MALLSHYLKARKGLAAAPSCPLSLTHVFKKGIKASEDRPADTRAHLAMPDSTYLQQRLNKKVNIEIFKIRITNTRKVYSTYKLEKKLTMHS